MEFYERMRELRKERKETQAQVAAATGMTDRQYQRFEAGRQKPGFDNFVALADHFGVSLDYLAGRSERRTP
jgi:transcriptional regulator with XRE-family HTH domain